jgi:hypothetical protein
MPLVVVVYFLMEQVLPSGRGPDGIYRGGDRPFLGIVGISVPLVIADRLVSWGFYRSGLSERRSSVFRRG